MNARGIHITRYINRFPCAHTTTTHFSMYLYTSYLMPPFFSPQSLHAKSFSATAAPLGVYYPIFSANSDISGPS